MRFCERCGVLMAIKRTKRHAYWVCRKCGQQALVDRERVVISEAVKGKKEVVVIREEETPGLPVTKIVCPKCEHREAYWWMIQMRAADEPPTIFYRCTRCKHTWRG